MQEEPMMWDPALADQWVDAWLADLRRQGTSDRTLERLARNLGSAAQCPSAIRPDSSDARALAAFLSWLSAPPT